MRAPFAYLAILLLAIGGCGPAHTDAPANAYAPDDAYQRLKVGMTSAQADAALGAAGLEITASGASRTLAWSRRGKMGVTATFMHDRLTAKRE